MAKDKSKTKNQKPKTISKGHMTFTTTESGYYNEMIGREDKTRWNFSLDKHYLYRERDPTLGEKTVRESDPYKTYYLPPEPIIHNDIANLTGTTSMSTTALRNKEEDEIYQEMKEIEALKRKRNLLRKEVHSIETTINKKSGTGHLAVQKLGEKPDIPERKKPGIRYALQMMSEGFTSSATPECIEKIMMKRLR